MRLRKINMFQFLKLFKLIKALISRIYLRILSIDLDIPRWHLNATYYVREYKDKVINICNYFNSDTEYVIEIGCGLGELVSRVNITTETRIRSFIFFIFTFFF